MKLFKKSKVTAIVSVLMTVILCLCVVSTRTHAADSQGKNSTSQIHNDSNTISESQADEMALGLLKKSWVWDWINFFVPYMSSDGVKQIIPTAQSAEWANKTSLKPFSQSNIDASLKVSANKVALTKKDIDAHALYIMQMTANWEYMTPMIPYMTTSGIDNIKIIYTQKTGESPSLAKENSQTLTDADSKGINIMDKSGTWGDSIERLLPQMSPEAVDKVVSIYLDRHIFDGYTYDQVTQVLYKIKSAFPYMSSESIKKVNNMLSTYSESMTDDNALSTYLESTTEASTSEHSSKLTDADSKGINIMDKSGTWGDSIERLLPQMSPEAVDKVVSIYLDRHIFDGYTYDQVTQVLYKIKSAFPYMSSEAESIKRIRTILSQYLSK